MAPAAAPAGLRSSRPTISLAGRESPLLAMGLLAMRVEESIEGIAGAEIAVGDWGPVGSGTGFLYQDRREIDFGMALSVALDGGTLFEGRISALESGFPEGSPPTLTLIADDRLQDLRMTRRTRTFEDLTDAAIAERIAADHGLTPDVRLDGPRHRVVAQLNQSDLAFLWDRARAVGAEVWVEARTLSVRRRTDRGAAAGGPVELGYGHELRELTVTADLAHQATTLTVSGWDVAAKEAIRASAGTDALAGELAGGEAAAAILGRALAPRTASVAHTAPLTGPEAQARADALYRARARRFVRAQGLADTSSGLRAGRTVTLSGIGPLFSGAYVLTEVRHVFDPVLGLRTEFGAERAWLGRP